MIFNLGPLPGLQGVCEAPRLHANSCSCNFLGRVMIILVRCSEVPVIQRRWTRMDRSGNWSPTVGFTTKQESGTGRTGKAPKVTQPDPSPYRWDNRGWDAAATGHDLKQPCVEGDRDSCFQPRTPLRVIPAFISFGCCLKVRFCFMSPEIIFLWCRNLIIRDTYVF